MSLEGLLQELLGDSEFLEQTGRGTLHREDRVRDPIGVEALNDGVFVVEPVLVLALLAAAELADETRFRLHGNRREHALPPRTAKRVKGGKSKSR